MIAELTLYYHNRLNVIASFEENDPYPLDTMEQEKTLVAREYESLLRALVQVKDVLGKLILTEMNAMEKRDYIPKSITDLIKELKKSVSLRLDNATCEVHG